MIAKIRAEGAEPPAMLQVLEDAGGPSFYRGGHYLGRDGAWHPVTP